MLRFQIPADQHLIQNRSRPAEVLAIAVELVGPPTFDGFKSRWITPVSCSAASADFGHRDRPDRPS
ncbi:MAG: hypothetical protein H6711_14330 [Myxococcales bacterium]|nr:hypothetical protein [Myxococcales bacterium]